VWTKDRKGRRGGVVTGLLPHAAPAPYAYFAIARRGLSICLSLSLSIYIHTYMCIYIPPSATGPLSSHYYLKTLLP
jgi:hypothetical protein